MVVVCETGIRNETPFRGRTWVSFGLEEEAGIFDPLMMQSLPGYRLWRPLRGLGHERTVLLFPSSTMLRVHLGHEGQGFHPTCHRAT